MSYDQKPARIKLVGSGGRSSAPEDANAVAAVDEQPAEDTQPDSEPARRSPVMVAVVFLAGSAIGGAGLVAWPHLAG